jgi:hypothetical protein
MDFQKKRDEMEYHCVISIGLPRTMNEELHHPSSRCVRQWDGSWKGCFGRDVGMGYGCIINWQLISTIWHGIYVGIYIYSCIYIFMYIYKHCNGYIYNYYSSLFPLEEYVAVQTLAQELCTSNGTSAHCMLS